MLGRRILTLVAALQTIVFVVPLHPAAAVAGLNLSADCNPELQCVEAQCEASVALVEGDGQLTIAISGTAAAEGPLAPAATMVACSIQQFDPGSGTIVSRGGCSLRLPGAASACAATVPNVPLELFDVCAGGDAVFVPTGYVSTNNCQLIANA